MRWLAQMQAGQPKKKKQKSNMGLKESFDFLARSPYIRDLATLVRAAPARADSWRRTVCLQAQLPGCHTAAHSA